MECSLEHFSVFACPLPNKRILAVKWETYCLLFIGFAIALKEKMTFWEAPLGLFIHQLGSLFFCFSLDNESNGRYFCVRFNRAGTIFLWSNNAVLICFLDNIILFSEYQGKNSINEKKFSTRAVGRQRWAVSVHNTLCHLQSHLS